MIRDIVIYGDPVLRKKCPRVTRVTDEIKTLVDDMLETMVAANGIGLAAPQVGVELQLAVIDLAGIGDACTYLRVDGEDVGLDSIMPLVFTNPEITPDKEREVDTEGCLSFPEIRAEIRRPASVTASLTLLDGRTVQIVTDGLFSRAIQHETDHLNGVLFIDRISSAAKLTMKKKVRRMQEEFGPRLVLEKARGAGDTPNTI